jgi:hypothetical protein
LKTHLSNFRSGQDDNELRLWITNNFYGWGIIARLYSLDGISFGKKSVVIGGGVIYLNVPLHSK